jgi:hypothetical protein
LNGTEGSLWSLKVFLSIIFKFWVNTKLQKTWRRKVSRTFCVLAQIH